jgi:hypothetical protein
MLRRVAFVTDVSEKHIGPRHQGDKNRRARNNISIALQELVTVSVVPSSPFLVTLMMGAVLSC